MHPFGYREARRASSERDGVVARARDAYGHVTPKRVGRDRDHTCTQAFFATRSSSQRPSQALHRSFELSLVVACEAKSQALRIVARLAAR